MFTIFKINIDVRCKNMFLSLFIILYQLNLLKIFSHVKINNGINYLSVKNS